MSPVVAGALDQTDGSASVPPNVEFFIDDLEADWTFVNPFDFIYLRCLNGSIRNWPKLINQAYESVIRHSPVYLPD